LRNHQASAANNALARHLIIFFSTGLYSGYCPVAPGTVGTMVAVFLYLVLSRLSVLLYGATVVAFLFMACWFSGVAETVFEKKDSRRIVIDEFGGFLVTMAFLPPRPLVVLSGFLLFRFFDICKPFPLKRVETLRGGCGVVADDVLAGIYSNLVLHMGILLFGQNSSLPG
jgi:phosphatidylglycerophosphatase A